MRNGFLHYVSLALTVTFLLYGCGSGSNVNPFTSSTNIALLSITGSGTYDFGGITIGSSSQTSFTVVNSGRAAATSLTASVTVSAFSFAGGFPGAGGTCAPVLSPGSSCTIVVTFAPTYAGSFQDLVSLLFNNGSGNVTVNAETINGTGLVATSLWMASDSARLARLNRTLGTQGG